MLFFLLVKTSLHLALFLPHLALVHYQHLEHMLMLRWVPDYWRITLHITLSQISLGLVPSLLRWDLRSTPELCIWRDDCKNWKLRRVSTAFNTSNKCTILHFCLQLRSFTNKQLKWPLRWFPCLKNTTKRQRSS